MTGVRKNAADSLMIHFGATAQDLAGLFDMPPAKVKQRLAGRVAPMTAAESSAPRWRVKDAGPYLVNPKIDVEEFLRTLTPAKLPPKLQAAFWQAQNERLDFEERQGMLFSADRVREFVIAITKPMRMTILMAKDEIAQRTEVTPEQRKLLEAMSDQLLTQIRDGLQKAFEGYEPPVDEHGRPIDEIALEAEMAAQIAADEHGDSDDMDRPTQSRPPKPRKHPVGEGRFVEAPSAAVDNGDWIDDL